MSIYTIFLPESSPVVFFANSQKEAEKKFLIFMKQIEEAERYVYN